MIGGRLWTSQALASTEQQKAYFYGNKFPIYIVMVGMKKYMIILLPLFLLLSCGKDGEDTTMQLRIVPVNNGMLIPSGQTVAATDGRRFFLQKLYIYLSDIIVVNSSGARFPVKEVFLYKWGADEFITVNIPAGSYDSLIFGLGLSETLNNANPNAFPDNHPLSIAQDMYWPMLKYRFVVREGAGDTTLSKTGVVNFPLTYHLGDDELYRPIKRAFSFIVEEGENRTINIPVELNAIFDGPGGTIDMRTHFSNHSTDMDKAAIMINNLAVQMEQ
jgi:hypothetical protein